VGGGTASTMALEDSTEAEQFEPIPCAAPPMTEEILMPSGD
jgi:hypothetical protein